MKFSSIAGLLGVAILALSVTPVVSAPTPGDNILDVLALVDVDLNGLEELLNALLGSLLGLSGTDRCKYPEKAKEIAGIAADILVYIDLLGLEVTVLAQLKLFLAPLLEAVANLLEALLGGLLVDLSIVINLILNLLATLNLELDLGVALQLGNLLNLDVLALLRLG